MEKSTKTNPKSFESPITQKGGLPYINLKLSPLPPGQQLIIKNERKQTTSHDSTNSTIGHIRSKTSQWQQRHMDDEQTRIHRAHPQALEESTLHTIQQQVSHQYWGLQKDHHQTTRKGGDHHRGRLSAEGEEGSEQDHRRISMDWRNMAQTKSISIEKQYAHMPRATTPRQIMQEHQKAKIVTEKKEEASTPKPATRHYGKQPHKPSIDIPGSGQHMSPPDPTDKTSDYWIREGHLWKRAHVVPRTSYVLLLSRVAIRWTSSWQPTSIKNDNHQTFAWQSTTTHRRWMDNRNTATTLTTVDRINQLCIETIIQGTTWGRCRG